MTKKEQYAIPNTTSNSPSPSVQDPSPRESLSIKMSNDYMELQRLPTISSGWLADEDSDMNSEVHYYNFPLIRNAHSAPNILATF